MTLTERIAALRNEDWYLPFFALQQLVGSKRQHNQLMSFSNLLKNIYRGMTGRLNRPSRWEKKSITREFVPSTTLERNYHEQLAEPILERTRPSQNHIGLFSILTVGIFDLAENALRGNYSRHDYIRRRLSLFTLPLWGIINLTRAAFGVIATAIAFVPAVIFYRREQAAILKAQHEIAAREYENKCDRNIESIIKTLSTPRNKQHTAGSYWRIREDSSGVYVKYKTKPVSKKGSYDAIYCSAAEQPQLAERIKDTVGDKLKVDAASALENVSLFKAPVSNKMGASKQSNRKFIYIPPVMVRK